MRRKMLALFMALTLLTELLLGGGVYLFVRQLMLERAADRMEDLACLLLSGLEEGREQEQADAWTAVLGAQHDGYRITVVDAGGGVTILPVCKVSFGFVTGGSEYPKSQKEAFGGGNGGGVTIVPIAFLVIKNGDVSLLQVQSFSSTSDRVVGMVPEVMDKISGLVASLKKNTASGDKAEGSPAAPDDGMDPAGK